MIGSAGKAHQAYQSSQPWACTGYVDVCGGPVSSIFHRRYFGGIERAQAVSQLCA
jgi:hypothetical protein